MNTILRDSEVVSEADHAAVLPGSIFSFLPAHGESRVGAVAELVSRTLTEGFGLVVSRADYVASRERYEIICVDLTGADTEYASEAVRVSDGIFIVTGSDRDSLQAVRKKAEWLDSIGVAEQCGLLLWRSPGGVDAGEAEELTGLPVCGLVDNDEQIRRFACWLGVERRCECERHAGKDKPAESRLAGGTACPTLAALVFG